jgi:antitoxin (DNA-binding transcriptional repressor) of toxin-antitoxin stability system
MSTIVSLEEAKAHLGELIEHLSPGDEIIIPREQQAVA